MLLFGSFRSCQPIHMSSPASCRRISSRRLRTCTENAVFLNSSQLLLSASCHLQSYSAKATFCRTHAQQSSCVSAFGLSMQHSGTKSLPNTQDPFAAAMHSADLMFFLCLHCCNIFQRASAACSFHSLDLSELFCCPASMLPVLLLLPCRHSIPSLCSRIPLGS